MGHDQYLRIFCKGRQAASNRIGCRPSHATINFVKDYSAGVFRVRANLQSQEEPADSPPTILPMVFGVPGLVETRNWTISTLRPASVFEIALKTARSIFSGESLVPSPGQALRCNLLESLSFSAAAL